MGNSKHILILCSRLDLPGGIERAIANTANLLQSKGHQITLLIFDATTKCFFSLDKEIKTVSLPLNFGITESGNFLSRKLSFLTHIQLLKRKIKEVQPGVIISTEYPFTIAAVIAAKNISVYSWEHHHFNHLQKSAFWKMLHKKFYPKTTAVVCLNTEEARFFKVTGCKTEVIPNFILQGECAPLTNKMLLTIGWLSKGKGVDLIPAIAEKVFAKHPDWQWRIIGTGELEKEVKEQLLKKNLSSHVSILPSINKDVTSTYLSSSIYVMTSRFECFPMVLLEASSHGVPSIAFNCATGPRHIITHDENGYLIDPNNVDEMATAIIELITNEEKRQAFGVKAYQSAARFHPEKVYPLWKKLFAE